MKRITFFCLSLALLAGLSVSGAANAGCLPGYTPVCNKVAECTHKNVFGYCLSTAIATKCLCVPVAQSGSVSQSAPIYRPNTGTIRSK